MHLSNAGVFVTEAQSIKDDGNDYSGNKMSKEKFFEHDGNFKFSKSLSNLCVNILFSISRTKFYDHPTQEKGKMKDSAPKPMESPAPAVAIKVKPAPVSPLGYTTLWKGVNISCDFGASSNTESLGQTPFGLDFDALLHLSSWPQ